MSIFPCARWNDMLLIKFPRVKPRLFHLYVFTYKIDLFSYCRIFTNSFPFSNRQITQCSTLGASQHSSIPLAKFLFVFVSQASRAGDGEASFLETKGILKWGIDECCGAWREEHGITRPFANGINLKARRQY